MSNAKSFEQQSLEGKTDSLKRLTIQGDGVPVKPRNLDSEGTKFWKTSVVPLIESGVAKAEDQQALEAMLFWWVVFKKSQSQVLTLEDFGSTQAQRTINANSRAFDNYRRLAQQFGLTAQARNSVSPGEIDDDLAEFMGG